LAAARVSRVPCLPELPFLAEPRVAFDNFAMVEQGAAGDRPRAQLVVSTVL
jgi:hypothetical protein